MSPQNEPIAIIGVGCRLPGECSTPSKFWELLKAPRDIQQEIPLDRFNAQNFYHPDGSHHGTSNVKHAYLLSEDYKKFDAQFFGMKTAEAQATDPQQRLILETVFEALESGGLDVAALRGSDTGCFVGSMTHDYNDLLGTDQDLNAMYQAPGTAQSILSNRVSYCFDLKGPSMTVDTACSSSLVALHLAVQSLRAGESRVSIVAGSSIILTPYPFIAESKLSMLSPTGRSRMWDRDADGYARGEGVVSIIVKLLKDALADGDPIECIIRETGLNQDGATTGITMPSAKAQAELIRKTYHNAGLDLDKPCDRPQFFEAHGTGTPAGDPQEAEAINRAFFDGRKDSYPNLLVGSVKTVVGHTEGTAGLTSVLKMCKSLQEKTFCPNLLFKNLNPTLVPFYSHLEVSTSTSPWPQPPHGGVRRASVNSFGFGGANSHAILEEYRPPYTNSEHEKGFSSTEACLVPFLFSASSETTLRRILSGYSSHLLTTANISPQDLAFTLSSKRSSLAHRAYFAADSLQDLQMQLARRNDDKTSNFPRAGLRKGGTIGVFTGQGAQWAGMGKQLILKSQFARDFLMSLEKRLSGLGDDSPLWSLTEELLKDPATSRIGEAAFSQPLCTAIQLLLIAMIRASNIELTAVVGHSSGEIAAAYASGVIPTPEDAICIAYLRGKYTKFSGGASNGPKGAMMAVGTTAEDIEDLLSMDEFQGRVSIAAFNSPQSLTLSGDLDTIEEVRDILEEEKKFARLLKVDQAYHSFHMNPCAEPYLNALERAGIATYTAAGSDTTWFSSTRSRTVMVNQEVPPSYWIENMVQPVLFHQALELALEKSGPFANAIEIGPHPTLKSPFNETMKVLDRSMPYLSTLRRNTDDARAYGELLGNLWASFDDHKVDFQAYDVLMSSGRTRRLVNTLPTYPWDLSRSFWWESRTSRMYRQRRSPPHSLLGTKINEGVESEPRWQNRLRLKELPWLNGHRLQSQPVLPGAAYIVCVIEAALSLPQIRSREIKLIEVEEVKIVSALVFNEDDDAGVETIFSLTQLNEHGDTLTGQAKFFSVATPESDDLQMNMMGRLVITFGTPDPEALPPRSFKDFNLSDVSHNIFYDSLSSLGYHYSGPFRTLSSIKRRLGFATTLLPAYHEENSESPMLIHPTTLDTLFHGLFAAYCCPNDGRLSKLHVPVTLSRVSVDPYHWAEGNQVGSNLHVEATEKRATAKQAIQSIEGSVQVSWSDDGPTVLQIEEISLQPFSNPTEADDRQVFAEKKWAPADLDVDAAMYDDVYPPETIAFAEAGEKLSFYYMRKIEMEISGYKGTLKEPHHYAYMNWIKHELAKATNGLHEYILPSWFEDEEDDIRELTKKYEEHVDVRMVRIVGEYLPRVMKGELGHILEYMRADGVLDEYYVDAVGFDISKYAGRLLRQLSFRYPQLNILEVGAGTGGSTVSILAELGQTLGSYTFTDISSGFFEQAEKKFANHSSKLVFKVLNIEVDPLSQGFEANSYDVVVAAFVMHATLNLEASMRNVRRLLKPGGYLMLLECVNPDILTQSFIFGALSGWWLGAEDGRVLTPLVDVRRWDDICKKTGFDGAKSIRRESRSALYATSPLICRAIDPSFESVLYPLTKPLKDSLIPQIYLVGGWSSHASSVHGAVKDQLQQFYATIIEVQHLEALLDFPDMDHTAHIISLLELDTPLFQNMTAERLGALKKLFASAESLLWVHCSPHFQTPFTAMTVSLSSAVSLEYPRTAFSMLDLELLNGNQASLICESMLRMRVTPASSSLWSTERELATKNGGYMISRYIRHDERNARYNARQRSVVSNVPADALLCLENDGRLCTLFEVPRWQSAHDTYTTASNSATVYVTVTHSTLSAIRVANFGHHYLVFGHDDAGQVVATFTTTLRSKLHVHRSALVPLGQRGASPNHLAAVALSLVAKTIIYAAGGDCGIVLLDAPYVVIATVRHLAEDKGLGVTALTTQKDRQGTSIHPRATRQSIAKLIPDDTALFVGFADDMVNSHFRGSLNSSVLCWDTSDLLSPRSLVRAPAGNGAQLLTVLQETLTVCKATPLSMDIIDSVELLRISSIQSHVVVPTNLELLDWSTDEETVAVQVLPVTSTLLFSARKTYWLIGLTGDLGQSLCVWMIENGARHIVLSSRNPRIDQKWRDTVEKMGANVYTWSNDITKLEDVQDLIHKIDDILPPLGGVAQGAMVLNDVTFADMTFNQYEKVTKPKVQGSLNLETVLKDRPLDFMVYFSSIAATHYHIGQTNYSLANSFLVGLAEDRRRRGLAGSVIHIGVLLGCGYVTREMSEESQQRLTGGGLNVMSEVDLHTLFAEACISTPESGLSAQLITGPSVIDPDSHGQTPWIADPRMSHFIASKSVNDASKGATTGMQSLQTRLLSVMTVGDALGCLRLAFATKLRKLLQLQEDVDKLQVTLPSYSLVELGVDSLVAVEIRTWFWKELEVDIPVLQIIGGSTFGKIIAGAVIALPQRLTPLWSKEDVAELNVLAESLSNLPVISSQEQSSEPVKKIQASTSAPNGAATNGVAPVSKVASTESVPSRQSHTIQRMDSAIEHTKGHEIRKAASPELERRQKQPINVIPFSPAQEGFWQFFSLYPEQTNLTNIAISMRLHGSLDTARLSESIKAIGQRHAALRSRYYVDQNQNRVQEILPESSIAVEVKEIDGPSTFQKHLSEMRAHKYDLAAGKGARMGVYILGEEDYFIVCGCSHMSLDADALGILVEEVNLAYQGVPLPTRGLDFDDYLLREALKVNDAAWKKDMNYWSSELSDSPPPPLFPPNKFTEQPTLHRLGERQYRHVMSDTLEQQVKRKCRETKSTPFQFYLSCVAKLIGQTTGSTDFTINVLDRNRNSPETQTLVGLTRNELPLRFRNFDSSALTSTCIPLAREKLFKAIEHGSIPGEILEKKFGLIPLCLLNMPLMLGKGAKLFGQEIEEWSSWSSWGAHSFQFVFMDGAFEGVGTIVMARLQEMLFDEREGQEFLDAFMQTVEKCAYEV